MLFVLYCLDKPNHLDVRMANREAHLAYAHTAGGRLKLGGPLLAEDGETMIGSLIVLEAEDLAAAEEWSVNDPYRRSGLFERVTIYPFRLVVNNLRE